MRTQGFSLVELSIVLVILGLLTGGILAGQSLIHAAELRSISTQYQQYVSAAHSFRDKYMAIPGDMTKATAFWGKNNAVCSGDPGNDMAAAGTCNGNGNGIIDPAIVNNGTGERYQFWKQLALAGMIEGTYSGTTGGAVNRCIIGTSCPRGKVRNSGWFVANGSDSAWTGGSNDLYAMDYGNLMGFGTSTSQEPEGVVMTPQEQWNIDVKMDDGLPARGKMIARNWWNECASADDGNSTRWNHAASYRLSAPETECSFYIRNFM